MRLPCLVGLRTPSLLLLMIMYCCLRIQFEFGSPSLASIFLCVCLHLFFFFSRLVNLYYNYNSILTFVNLTILNEYTQCAQYILREFIWIAFSRHHTPFSLSAHSLFVCLRVVLCVVAGSFFFFASICCFCLMLKFNLNDYLWHTRGPIRIIIITIIIDVFVSMTMVTARAVTAATAMVCFAAICPYARRGIIHTVTHYPIENRFSLFLSRFDSLRDSLQRRDNDIIIAILYAHTRQYRYCV